MPFKSQAQRRYFYAKASEGGKEGKRFKKYIAEMEAKTPKGKKLPERVKTASHEKIAIGKELEIAGRLVKGRFGERLVSAGQGIRKKTKDLLLTDVYPKQKSFLSRKNQERAATVFSDFVADPLSYAASATPYALTGAPIPGMGVAYALGREKVLRRLARKPTPLRNKKITQVQMSSAPTPAAPRKTKTASQVAFEHGFFLETEKIAKKDDKVDRTLQALPGIGAILGGAFGGANPDAFNPEALFPKYIKKVGINSPQARAMSALLGAGTMATIGWLPSTLRDTYRASAGKKSK